MLTLLRFYCAFVLLSDLVRVWLLSMDIEFWETADVRVLLLML